VRAIARRHEVTAYAALVLALAIPLTFATRLRNLVFLDEYAYWKDCAEKDPVSGRAQLNYGLELWQAKNGRPRDIEEAERRFREAVRLWPGWLFGHVNLAMLLDEEGRLEEANREFDLAVICSPGSSIPVYYRGLSRIRHGDTEGAIHDLEIAVHQASVKTREQAALAEAYLKAGRTEDARAQIEAGEAIDPGAFANVRTLLPR